MHKTLLTAICLVLGYSTYSQSSKLPSNNSSEKILKPVLGQNSIPSNVRSKTQSTQLGAIAQSGNSNLHYLPRNPSPIRMITDNDSSNANEGYLSCVCDYRDISFITSLYSKDSDTLRNVVFHVDVFKDSLPYMTYSSDSNLVSPFDTIINLTIPSFRLPRGSFHLEFYATSDSIGRQSFIDSNSFQSIPIVFSPIVGVHSNTFGNWVDGIGTKELGVNNSAIGSLFHFRDGIRINAIEVGIGDSTTAGSDLIIEIYDTAGFSQNGMGSFALLSENHTILQNEVISGKAVVDFTDYWGSPSPIQAGAYFIVVNMYANYLPDQITLLKDTTIAQSPRSTILYNINAAMGLGIWSYDTSNQVNALALNLITDGCLYPHPTCLAFNIVEKTKLDIQLSPNPVNDILLVSSTLDLDNRAFYFLDLSGRAMLEGKLQGSTNKINVKSLPKGLYFLTIEGLPDAQKVIIH